MEKIKINVDDIYRDDVCAIQDALEEWCLKVSAEDCSKIFKGNCNRCYSVYLYKCGFKLVRGEKKNEN